MPYKDKEKAKERKRQYYEENRNKIKECSRLYYISNTEKVKARTKQYTEENPEKYNEYSKKMREKYPEKVKARRAVSHAIRSGHLIRSTECAACHKSCKPEAHHEDYAKPLDVEWLCNPCHKKADKQF